MSNKPVRSTPAELAKNIKRAKELYREGLDGPEVATEMKKGVATIWRYFKGAGGITKVDLAWHYYNRYIVKGRDADTK